MKENYILITGSDGLIGSEAVKYFAKKGYKIIGIDNNSRKKFFGSEASVLHNRKILKDSIKNYIHINRDIVNKNEMEKLFKEYGKKIKLIIHAAAQPSHDWAAQNPSLDFKVNAVGTLNLLECFKNFCPDSVFIFTSTNKVYGDNPNSLNFIEESKRYSIEKNSKYKNGIDENMSIDNTLHSLFGVSKTSADLLVQEYGKYFKLKTGVFRGGCLTGPGHSGTLLHGFLSYLIKCTLSEDPYTIFGYKGKQVRDNIHSYDLIKAFDEFFNDPKEGEVYNIGGGLKSNCSMLEAIDLIEINTEKKLNYNYVDKPRVGDHKWYISDLSKFKNHYPNWKLSYSIETIIEEICKTNYTRWANSYN